MVCLRPNDFVVLWLRLQTPSTDCIPHIHLICIQSVWASLDAMDGHMGVPLHTVIQWEVGQVEFLAEPKWLCCVMVESETPSDCIPHSQCVKKVFEHLMMLWMGIWVYRVPSHCNTCAGGGRPGESWIFGKFGWVWGLSPNDSVVSSWLSMQTPTDCIPHS